MYNTRTYSVFHTDSFEFCNVRRYPLRIYVLIQIVINNYEKVEDRQRIVVGSQESEHPFDC